MLDFVASQPADVGTHETLQFIMSRTSAGAKVLEIGCGQGELAGELLKRGYRVTGLDSDPKVIAKAQARGVPAIVGSWPTFNDSVAFDAIAFTRSLHHINPLPEAIARARELLNPAGLLLLEDFSVDDVDERTVHWFAKILRSKQARVLIGPVSGELVTELLAATDMMKAWHENRAHDLHSFAMMSEAISQQFIVRETQSVPYFYRYLVPVLAKTSSALSFMSEVFQEEKLLGEEGEIVLLGRRIVASPGKSKGRIPVFRKKLNAQC